MPPHATRSTPARWAWLLLILALLALRVPAFAEPAGNDQSLYMYVADRVRTGGVPYLDAWDQKPPAIYFVYAALRDLWPTSAAVALGDLAAAGLVAWLLVVLGRRTAGAWTGYLAAAVFLLFGHPSIERLSGVYVRGQCEVFMGLAVTAALVLLWRRERCRHHVVLAGAWLAIAFWLKYNALAYALPAGVALLAGTDDPPRSLREIGRQAGWLGAGFGLVSLVVLAYFGAHGGLDALRLATLDYNLRYAGETYQHGITGALAYVVTLPFDRARGDLLWFLGGAGLALLLAAGHGRTRPVAALVTAWLAAAVLSIAVNGARDLPQYFVQAAPALALAWAAGTMAAAARGRVWRAAILVVLAAGLWKVGVDSHEVLGMRWGGIPQLAENVGFDVRYLTGAIDRETYLARFHGAQKYDAAAVEALARYVRTTTAPSDRILVFGFAPAAYLESHRTSASRFFWSRPVIVEFEAQRPGYGTRGLLADLEATPPAIVALQKQDWRPDVANSMEFFLGTAPLRDWLMAGYVLDRDTPTFSVWRREIVTCPAAHSRPCSWPSSRSAWSCGSSGCAPTRPVSARSASSGTTKERGCTMRATGPCGACGAPTPGTRCSSRPSSRRSSTVRSGPSVSARGRRGSSRWPLASPRSPVSSSDC